MSYIGREPIIGNFVKLDAISVVNGQASYTMQNGGANFTAYETVNQFLVSLNGILQAPTTSFTVSGSTITFASNLVTGDVIDFILVLGNTLDIGTPSDNTVSLAKLTATGTKDATTFLRGDNTFDVPPLGGITEADQWRITADKTGIGDFDSNWERNDTTGFGYLGTGMSQSSGIFTFPSTGIWFIKFNTTAKHVGTDSYYILSKIQTTTNNSTYSDASNGYQNAFQDGALMTIEQNTIFDCTSTSTHKVKFNFAASVRSGAETFIGNTNKNLTYATFIRLGDT